MNAINFDILVDDVIIQIALQTEFNELVELIKSNKKVRELIYYNQDFWKQKASKDFGKISKKYERLVQGKL